ncbi:flagellin [Phenylobacterium soli]|uniref:Flagellin n=1 Tax=Phenylobacterium soli TaxID=2170551 RepID=A0A328AP34_9CAUL|nr:flagellin [Phenylobacterium soli]RAK55616.1 flagellin [Phenylobacterium soli]
MVTSVNGNALAALQARENALANRSTGAPTSNAADAVGGVRDPAVVYAGPGELPGASALLSVQDSLNRAASIADVAMSAGQTIGDLLKLMREKAVSAQSGGADKASLDADYQQLLQTLDQIARSASFQGVKMLDGGSTGDLQFKADVNGDASISLSPQDFTADGLGLARTGLSGADGDLAGLLDQLDAAGASVAAHLAKIGGQSEQIQAHLAVVSRLQTSLANGASSDLDADTARLQALQVQQALAGQGGGVANQAPQALLALFRS